ncbi:glycosyltransferase family 39 protein [Nonomuraea ceibae]|uniref:glycosyltransferase family 39 protein n=1 Tax=Nonomuraea ceibae TaxID=1935170 RepID=UPI001C5D2290|nr:glycosyltransferase family 39 protein [Nonomuraea ceibae]
MELARTRAPAAGRVLAVVTVLPALAVAGWLLAGLGLLLADGYRPLPAFLIGLPVAAALCWAGARRAAPLTATAGQTATVLAVALGSGAFNAVLHSEQLLVRRDPATYAQYAVWLARHGSLPIDPRAEAFGGPDPALVFDSIGFYRGDGAVVPQFMPGPPLLYALGEWLGGMLLTPAVLGALAVLVVGGLAARLVGGWWAPVAALAFAVSMPVLYTSRTTFSEIPSVILLFGGLALVHDALERERRALAALAGLVFGLSVLVRVDGLRDVLPALAFAGLLIALRRLPGRTGRLARGSGAGLPLLAGLLAGAGAGLLAAYVLSHPYLNYLSRSVEPLLLICGAVLLLTAAGTAAAPALARVRLPRRLPEAGAALVVLVMAGLAVRPWVQTVRREPDNVDDRRTFVFIEQIQKANGLPPDGSRLYFENSLHWVGWYIGVPAVVLATLAAAVLLRRLLRGRETAWLLPLAVIGWTTLTTLLRPEITPDHPWAARRLVPVVIPGLVLLAVWGARWLARRFPRRFPRRWAAPVLALLVLAPPVFTSIGTAFTPVERGEAAAVARMCARIPDDASVVIVERVTGDRFTQVVRGMCGAPAAKADEASEDDVRRVLARVRAAGRTPVVLAAESGQVAPYGTPQQVMTLVTRQDERSLTSRPDGTWSLRVNVWMAIP